jgi:16S rRNA (uracil1498-N3)-methyltransferase
VPNPPLPSGDRILYLPTVCPRKNTLRSIPVELRSVHRFFAPGFAVNQDVELPDEEAQHLARVLRMKPGDAIAIFDGKGHESLARVETVGARRVVVRATEPRQAAAEPPIPLTLAQALLKGDKMDRVIRDAVMLGVAAVQPFVSKRTEVPRAALRTGVRQERWDRTVVSSVKQCGRAVVPPVLDPIDFGEMLRNTAGRTRLMFVEPSAATTGTVRELRSFEGSRPVNPMIVIGPEGGWDGAEVEAAVEAGVTLVTFGSRTLRADAAGAAALAVFQFLWENR